MFEDNAQADMDVGGDHEDHLNANAADAMMNEDNGVGGGKHADAIDIAVPLEMDLSGLEPGEGEYHRTSHSLVRLRIPPIRIAKFFKTTTTTCSRCARNTYKLRKKSPPRRRRQATLDTVSPMPRYVASFNPRFWPYLCLIG